LPKPSALARAIAAIVRPAARTARPSTPCSPETVAPTKTIEVAAISSGTSSSRPIGSGPSDTYSTPLSRQACSSSVAKSTRSLPPGSEALSARRTVWTSTPPSWIWARAARSSLPTSATAAPSGSSPSAWNAVIDRTFTAARL
jgi:hypothetical protein